MYTKKTGNVEIISGKITEIIPDRKFIKLHYTYWDRTAVGDGNRKGKESENEILCEVDSVEGFSKGDYVTLVKEGVKPGHLLGNRQSYQLKTGERERNGQKEDVGFTVIRGRLTFAGYRDEMGKVRQDGTAKKPHYDLLIQAGGKSHSISIYNMKSINQDLIKRAQEKYDGLNLSENTAIGTFITGLPVREYTRENGDYENTTVYYLGLQNPISDDLMTFKKERQQEAKAEAAEPVREETYTEPEVDEEVPTFN